MWAKVFSDMTQSDIPAILKLILFVILWLGFWLPIGIPIALVLQWHPRHSITEQQKLAFVISLYLVVALLFWGMSQWRFLSLSSYGLTQDTETVLRIIWGFSLGVISLIVLFWVEKRLGWLRWQESCNKPESVISTPQFLSHLAHGSLSRQKIGSSFLILGLGLGIAGAEEFIFRGFIQQILVADYGMLIATLITSSLFALSHLIWNVRQTWAQLPGLWLMGIVLTFACITNDGNLGFAIGVHGGWIWAMTTLEPATRLITTGKVPGWVTGVAGQPLAGVSGVLFLLATASLFPGIILISEKLSFLL